MNISSVSSQLDAIVAGGAPDQSQAPSSQEYVSTAISALESARAQGTERQFLEEQVAAINGVVEDMNAPVRFSVEVSEVGDYFVRVLSDSGEEIKTIPTETIVTTRERIRAEVKGLIEDSQN